jgi:hypothetical protein
MPSTYSFSWLLCDLDGRRCSVIPAATGTSYTPSAADSGHTIVAEVEATAGASSQAVLSAPSAPVG